MIRRQQQFGRDEKNTRTKETRLIILVVLLAVAVIALVITLTLQIADFGKHEYKEMCQSEECIRTGNPIALKRNCANFGNSLLNYGFRVFQFFARQRKGKGRGGEVRSKSGGTRFDVRTVFRGLSHAVRAYSREVSRNFEVEAYYNSS